MLVVLAALLGSSPWLVSARDLLVARALSPALLHAHGVTLEGLEGLLLRGESAAAKGPALSGDAPTELYLACGLFAKGSPDAADAPLLHAHLKLNHNSHVAYVSNLAGTVCALSALSHAQAREVRDSQRAQLHRFPSFMKIHESVLSFLTTNAEVPMHWSSAERRRRRARSGAFSKAQDIAAEASVLSIEIAPVYLQHGRSVSDVAAELLRSFSSPLASSLEHADSGHSEAWRRVMDRHEYGDTKGVTCDLPQSAEVSFSARSIEIANLANLPARCLVHLVHHSVHYSEVLRLVIHPRPVLMNYEARGLTQSGKIYVEPYREAGLSGAGQICGVGDSGVNDVSCFFLDDSHAYPTVTTARTGELQPLRRKIVQYSAYADATEDEAGHGSHVCGSIAGNSNGQELSSVDGMAPAAKIALFDLGITDKAYLKVPAVSEIFASAYSAGARVHTNSWGNPGGIYGQMSYDVDAYLFEHEDFLVLFAAGNDGHDGASTIIAPANAKNCLSVGAAQLRGVVGDKGFSADTSRIASFSSIGPTFDGRIKPDVVAPGDFIMSAYAGPIANLNNALSATARAESTCATHQMSGTSMATPVTAGTALLVRQFFMDPLMWGAACGTLNEFCLRKAFEPSGFLLKALLIHSGSAVARYSDPAYDAEPTAFASFPLDSFPDNFQGFGAVTLTNILPLQSGAGLDPKLSLFVSDWLAMKAHTTIKCVITFDTEYPEPLKVTVAWFDPPSVIGSVTSLLVHDLDLVVRTPEGDLHWGNEDYAGHDRGNHRKGHGDTANPVEQVLIARPRCARVPCQYEVFLHAHSLFARPTQHVAMVVTSSGAVADPSPASDPWFRPDSDDAPRSRHHNQTYSPVQVAIAASLRGAEAASTAFDVATCGHLRLVEATLRFNRLHCSTGESMASYIELTIQGPSGRAVSVGGADSSVGKARITTEWPSSWNSDANGEYTATIDLTDAKVGGIGEWTLYVMNSYSPAGRVAYDLSARLLFYGGPRDSCAPTAAPTSLSHKSEPHAIPPDELLSDFHTAYEVPFSALGLGVTQTSSIGSSTGPLLSQDRLVIACFPYEAGVLESVKLTVDAHDGADTFTLGTDAWLLALLVTAPDERLSVQVGGYHWLGRKDHFYYRHWPDPWLGRLSTGAKWQSTRDVSAAGLTGSRPEGALNIRNKGSPSTGKWVVELAMGSNSPRRPVNFTGTATLMFKDLDCAKTACARKVVRLTSFTSSPSLGAQERAPYTLLSLFNLMCLALVYLSIYGVRKALQMKRRARVNEGTPGMTGPTYGSVVSES